MEFEVEDCQIYGQIQQQQNVKLAEKRIKSSLKSSRIQKRSSTVDKKCTSCGTTSTPVWRWGGEAKEYLLCNACSLRIRRSAGRPGRSSSPGVRPQRKTHSSANTTSDSGALSADERDANSGGMPQVEDHMFRQRLHGLVIKERDRLLGSLTPVTPEDDWGSSQWASLPPLGKRHQMCPSTSRHQGWEPHRVYGGMSDTGRLEFACPDSPYVLGEPGIVSSIH